MHPHSHLPIHRHTWTYIIKNKNTPKNPIAHNDLWKPYNGYVTWVKTGESKNAFEFQGELTNNIHTPMVTCRDHGSVIHFFSFSFLPPHFFFEAGLLCLSADNFLKQWLSSVCMKFGDISTLLHSQSFHYPVPSSSLSGAFLNFMIPLLISLTSPFLQQTCWPTLEQS